MTYEELAKEIDFLNMKLRFVYQWNENKKPQILYLVINNYSHSLTQEGEMIAECTLALRSDSDFTIYPIHTGTPNFIFNKAMAFVISKI